jgi:AcrR family transcriptional regulator
VVPCARAPQDVLSSNDKELKCARRRQLVQRAHIFAEVRARIAQSGLDQVSLRELATDCETTVQTIFNLIGNRKRVIGEAIAEYGMTLVQAALQSKDYPQTTIGFADFMWIAAHNDPDYMQQASQMAISNNHEIVGIVRSAGLRCVRVTLNEMPNRRIRYSLDLLTKTVHSAIAASFSEWAAGMATLDDLRLNLVTRTSLLIAGASTPSAADEIERWLGEFLAPRSASPT